MKTELKTKKTSKKNHVVLIAVGVLLLLCVGCGLLAPTPPVEDVVVPSTARVVYSTFTPSPTHTMTPEPTERLTPIPESAPTLMPTSERQTANVVRVIDGDTIKVEIEGQTYTVRYIGIDTPETVHPSKPVEWMGQEASTANKQLVEGKVVYLEKDVSETDRYDRLLRYVYLDDGTFVNAELVRLGYAQVSTYPPDVKYQNLFLEMQGEAIETNVGLWGATPIPLPIAPQAPLTVAPQPQPTATLTSEYVCDCSSNTLNCGDFPTHAKAQSCYEYCISTVGKDVHGLDSDSDGNACESIK